MSTTLDQHSETRAVVDQAARRFGYLIAAAANMVLLWASHQLLDWGWPGFLTPEFEDLLPLLTVSFLVSIAANLVFAWNDRWPVKAVGGVITSLFGLAVAIRAYQVFPVDFGTYETDWSWAVRLITVAAIIGSAIGAITPLFNLVGRTDDE